MQLKPKFVDGRCEAGGVSIILPLKDMANIHIIPRLEALTIAELTGFGAALGVEVIPGVPVKQAVWAVASYVQLHWYLETHGKIPATIAENHDTRLRQYVKLVAQIKQGETPMAKGKKAVKKVKVAKEPKARGGFYIAGAKAPEKLGPQAQLVYDVVVKSGPIKPAEIADKIAERLTTKQKPVSVVSFYLGQFKAKGYVKLDKEAAKEAAAA